MDNERHPLRCKPGKCKRCDDIRAWLKSEKRQPNLDDGERSRRRYARKWRGQHSFSDAVYGIRDEDELDRER